MNILIKLMSIVSLVIAPHISVGGHGGAAAAGGDCCKNEKVAMHCANHMDMSKCDMKVCATMNRDECAKMCDSLGCDSTEKAHCMSMYNDKGEFVGQCMGSCGKKCTSKEECMKNCGESCASKHSDASCGHHGAGSDKACCKENGADKACASDPSKCEKKGKACCKDKK